MSEYKSMLEVFRDLPEGTRVVLSRRDCGKLDVNFWAALHPHIGVQFDLVEIQDAFRNGDRVVSRSFPDRKGTMVAQKECDVVICWDREDDPFEICQITSIEHSKD